jgi:geranylgeranyl diphosphate synthase type I
MLGEAPILGPRSGRFAEAVNAASFDEFVARVRAGVEARLHAWLDARVAQAAARGPDVEAVAEAVRQLVLRGGKRLRAALLAAAFEACGGEAGSPAVAAAGASLELLQAYLLVHDDWMDGDDVRRGGPSVPALMRERFAQQGDAASILAGDLACGWAQSCLLEADVAAPRLLLAARELARVQEEVVSGQMLDVRGLATDASAVEAVHALKTASYTVRAPVVIGASLAGAAEGQVGALAAFAGPLGVAFQLRDDVLGVFGDTRSTGKPSGSDLRKGKRTALVVEALRDPGASRQLARVLGRSDASDGDVQLAVAAIDASGARAHIELRILALAGVARAALDRAELTEAGRDLLVSASRALTDRER